MKKPRKLKKKDITVNKDHKKQNEEKDFIKSQNLIYFIKYLKHNRQTDRKNIHRKGAYIREECAQKKIQSSILISSKKSHVFFTFMSFVAWPTDRRTNINGIDAHIRGMYTEKNQLTNVIIGRENRVSIFLHFCLL